MIVAADTSPINYLILIEEINILTKMYGRVVITRAVRDELLRPSAHEMVRAAEQRRAVEGVERLLIGPKWTQVAGVVQRPN